MARSKGRVRGTFRVGDDHPLGEQPALSSCARPPRAALISSASAPAVPRCVCSTPIALGPASPPPTCSASTSIGYCT
jgi:hypothetical protein